MELNTIYNITFPDKNTRNIEELYFRTFLKQNFFYEGKFNDFNIISFDTWMNSFPVGKIIKYCDFDSLYLKIKISSKALVYIYGSSPDIFNNPISTLICQKSIEKTAVIPIVNFKKYSQLFFKIAYPKDSDFIFYSGGWCTESKPLRMNSICIVMCTYKREEYIKKNIYKFNLFINKYNLKDRIKLLIVDNAKTLKNFDLNFDNSNIEIIDNNNTGGAGGFARGIYEVKKKKKYTRICLLDDDVEIDPESLLRTLIISDYLKDEFKESFINGCMLELEHKNIVVEKLAIDNQSMWVDPINHPLDVNLYKSIFEFNETPDQLFQNPSRKVNAPWYFCCFTTKSVEVYGLPLPFFIRGDDVEWSWRQNGKRILSFNGINIWHSAFVWRLSKQTEYYFLFRNMFIVHSLYSKNVKERASKFLISKFKYLVRTYDYTTIKFLIKAMNDLLKGTKCLEIDPAITLSELKNIEKERKTRLATFNDAISVVWQNPPRLKGFLRYLYKKTRRGYFLPNSFYSKKLIFAPDFINVDVNYFALRKTVILFNPKKRQCEIRKYHHSAQRKITKKFYSSFNRFMENVDLIIKDFQKEFDYLTSDDFWISYLKLN